MNQTNYAVLPTAPNHNTLELENEVENFNITRKVGEHTSKSQHNTINFEGTSGYNVTPKVGEFTAKTIIANPINFSPVKQ